MILTNLLCDCADQESTESMTQTGKENPQEKADLLADDETDEVDASFHLGYN